MRNQKGCFVLLPHVKDRHTYRQRDRHTDNRHKDNGQTDRQAGRQTDRRTTDRHTDNGQTASQTDRQTRMRLYTTRGTHRLPQIYP